MPTVDQIKNGFAAWLGTLSRRGGDGVARGTLAAALVVLEHLRDDCNLDLSAHRAAGKSQLRGVGASAVRKILARHGETRPFLSEGGRTNRGGPQAMEAMLTALRAAGIQSLGDSRRLEAIDVLQSFLVEQVRAYHSRQRITFAYDPSKTIYQLVSDVLAKAREAGKDGPVAQYLVGAKLAMRFPDKNIENLSYSTADVQLNRPGVFLIGDTAIHVTISPQPALYEKCGRNLSSGYKVYVLVPETFVVGARQNADATVTGRISVQSIESFVSQNLEEMGEFNGSQRLASLRELLDRYNSRVDAVENDKSMLLEIPKNL